MTKLISMIVCALIWSQSLWALEEKVVSSLSQGSCWVSEGDEGASLVSFNQKVSLILSPYQVQEFLQTSLGINQEELKSLKTYTHCSAHSMAVVFNVETKFGKSCVWADINQEKLTLRDMGHTASEEGQGFCHGARFGELIAMTKGPEALSALENEIGQIFKGEGNPVIKRLTDRVYKITFDQSFYGQESVVRERLLASENLIPVITGIEYAPFYHPVGEAMALESFSYQE